MSELIDKQAAINAIEVLHGGCITKDVKNFVRYQLLCVPSAQPEIIRCKDCENYQTDWQPLSFDDGHYCAMVDTIMPYDGFCHMGERRTDE